MAAAGKAAASATPTRPSVAAGDDPPEAPITESDFLSSIVGPTINVGDKPPFGLMNPESDGKVTWICNYLTTGKIFGVYTVNAFGPKEEREHLQGKELTLEEAVKERDVLVSEGWQKLKLDLTIRDPKTGAKIPFTKKLGEKIAKSIEKKDKRDNPFRRKRRSSK
jgi:hypothetical protein